MDVKGIPLEHGMEIEQCESTVPDEILGDYDGEYFGYWEHDGSGPREYPGLGPKKQVKSMLRRFTETARKFDDEFPWEWTNETSLGEGCGSHAHLTVARKGISEEDFITGTTIAWNSTVELAPFLAPFWCHDWRNGFRSSVSRWASPQLTRYAPDSIRSIIGRNPSRSYSSVTFNPSAGNKPVTIEVRMNESHPAFALVGLTYLRRTITKCMRGGWSPKLAGSRRSNLNALYSAIYQSGDLINAMQSTGPFRFEEDRGLPGTDQLEYDSAWDVLLKVMAINGIDRGAYDDHVKKLIQYAGDCGRGFCGPQANQGAMWHTLDPDFKWERGPYVESRY